MKIVLDLVSGNHPNCRDPEARTIRETVAVIKHLEDTVLMKDYDKTRLMEGRNILKSIADYIDKQQGNLPV